MLNVNDWDPHFDQERYEFVITSEAKESSGGFKIGHVTIDDGDDDRVDLQLKGNDARYVVPPVDHRWLSLLRKFTKSEQISKNLVT